ncbi:hypothetical protein [Enterococcus caccae]|uniref:LPXTG-domain-containing protein cell wall anchor domain n=1 Tax=Enterococcus caccae ATCC BAA-1240 TaxID=1158612 RepID=R3WPE9_9ENTE|nr:hypothetical protein [Enterococcus caccae]EOL49307.1 hypothetical protein UC7_00684 [Enterococcus caccae ATCC BAA-1240]EOT56359.1 hypothetical protein I580_03159 [Enterococcus caccae ATCC BAA-1240]OJG24306.1 hypothetical protein RU98_GL001729 [Enterococcus caccae]
MKKGYWEYKWLLIGLFLLISLSLTLEPVEVNSESNLPPGMVVGDDQGIKIKNDGQYLVDIRDVAPGKKWSTKITIINIEKDTPYHLTMNISKPTMIEGTLDLSQEIQMTLIYEGKEVYKGPLSGVNKTVNLQDKSAPLSLGTFKSGDTKMLEAQFELDGKAYTNRDFFKKNSVENTWYFKAVKTTLPDTKEPDQPDRSLFEKIITRFRLPNTGEEWRNALLFSCVGLFLILVLLLIIKHKKMEKKPPKKKKNDRK